MTWRQVLNKAINKYDWYYQKRWFVYKDSNGWTSIPVDRRHEVGK